MARQLIDIGVEGNDGTGDSIRESFRKSNENFRELYAVFGQGGQISFTDLDDTPDTLTVAEADKLVAINNTGTSLVYKTLVSGNSGIAITSTDTSIIITNQSSSLKTDNAPELAFSLNAAGQLIGQVKNPDVNTVSAFNAAFGTNLNTDGRDFLVNKGYIESTFVHGAGDTMTGPLNVPAGATGTQVPQAQEVVMRDGDTMTGPLNLYAHPEAWDKVTPPDDTDYRAVSKYYVDTVNDEINSTIQEAGFASKDYVDAITSTMFEPTGYNRYDLDSLGIFEFTIDGITIYQINQNEVGSSRSDGKFASGTIWERPATAKTAAMYPCPGRTEFYVWQAGKKYSFPNLITSTFSTIDGSHFFFMNNGVLEAFSAVGTNFLQQRPFTALVYCNEAKNQVVVIGEERHGLTMDGTTHYYLHTTVGTRYRSGLGVVNITAGSSTYGGTASGIMYDEDIIITVPTQPSNRHFYLDGSMWAYLPENNNIAHMVSGVAYYNRAVSTGVYDLAPIPSGKYVLVYFISTNCSISHTVKIMGQRVFDSLAQAQNIAQSEPREIVFLGLPVAEFLYIGCVAVNSAGQVQTFDDGSTYVDLRQININAGINLTAAVQVNAVDVFFDKNASGLSSYDVQAAINEVIAPSGYLDKRLGLTKTNTVIAQNNLIGPGFLDRNGLTSWYGGSATPSLKNPLNMTGARISNVGSPTSDSDAANKLYVDSQPFSNSYADTSTSPAAATNDLLVFNGSKWVNAANATGSDISITLSTKSVNLSIKSGVIVDADVNASAAIDQTKLNLSNAYATTVATITGATATRSSTTATLTFTAQARAPFNTGQRITVTGFATTGYNGTFTVLSCNATTVTYTVDVGTVTPGVGTGTITSINGVASFDNAKFTATNGWVSLANSSSASTGVSLNNIQYIGGTSILGRRDGNSGPPIELTASNIVTDGDGIKNAVFTSAGAMTVVPTGGTIATGTGSSWSALSSITSLSITMPATNVTYIGSVQAGQTVSGTGLPAGATVTSWTPGTNTLVIGWPTAQSVAAGSNVTITIAANGVNYSSTTISHTGAAHALVKTNASGIITATLNGNATTSTTATYLNSAASSTDKDDITTRTNSGFWQSSTATKAEGWPEDSNTWAHLIASTHSNSANYYSMQFAGSFYDSNSLYYRATNGSGTTAWNKVWHAGNDGVGSGLDADLLDGYSSDTAASVNTIVRRDANGNVNGVTGSFTTSVLTPLLTTGAAATAGVVTGNWTLSSGSKLQATYADLAEYYEGDDEYESGTVVVFGGDKEVTLSDTRNDTRVAGVVTTNPAYVMNTECPGIKVCVALQGRVPCKVIGTVRKGDLIITSSIPGYATASELPRVGSVIGKALENKTTLDEGIIEIAVGRL